MNPMRLVVMVAAMAVGSVSGVRAAESAGGEPVVRAAFLIDGVRVEGEYHDDGGMRTLCTDTQCYFIPDDAVRLDPEGPAAAEGTTTPADSVAAEPPSGPSATETATGPGASGQVRRKEGMLGVSDFISFLRGEESSSSRAWYVVLLLAFFGGLAMNLTPCVLPMMPINLMIIGKSAVRGALYGLGIALAYGTMGLLAAFGGMAFGQIQGNPWFNLAIALLFLALSLSLFGVFMIDFSKRRKLGTGDRKGLFFPFVMGCVSAVLAGACVAPILLTVLFLTQALYASGNVIAVGLPFVFGLGMALPWPFAGAGMQVLPKPGAWMTKVNKLFGVVVLGFACWYGYLAFVGFRCRTDSETVGRSDPATFTADGLKRPVLIDCWATWCKNCTAMEKTTLADPAVKAELERFTVVRLQCEDMREMKQNPLFKDVKGLPAFIIIE